ncbi:GNAT family N-acetyltransferase [Flavobacteriaceae bacterium]|nr:GNAT family N-acetyltransferase [Flavobacteriaceae bacterium]
MTRLTHKVLEELKIKLDDQSLIILKVLEVKPTIRGCEKYILKGSNSKFLLEIGQTSVQNFYLKRKVKYKSEYLNYDKTFKTNELKINNLKGNISYLLYEYIDFNNKEEIDQPTISEYFSVKSKSSKNHINSEELTTKIINDLLSIWPVKFHAQIKKIQSFKLLKKELKQLKDINVNYEHGDFTLNNMKKEHGINYLLDFEFFKEFQPIGFDQYDYFISSNQNKDIPYKNFNKLKFQFINDVNYKLDSNTINIIIYNNINDEDLISSWSKISKSLTYNNKFDWCKSWIEFYLKEDDLFLFTIWEDDTLSFFAPLYKRNNQLLIIGSDPDYFDYADFYCTSNKFYELFFDYLFTNNYDINFRNISSDTVLTKQLFDYSIKNNISKEVNIVDMNPFLKLIQDISPKFKADIKRIKNKITKKSIDLEFIFEDNKNQNLLDLFFEMHIKRWDGGPTAQQYKFKEFITAIFYNDDVIISTLKFDSKIISIHLGYMQEISFLSSIPVYDVDFQEFSPGKLMISNIIDYLIKSELNVLDFGRGNESYKLQLYSDQSIIFHFKSLERFSFFKLVIYKIYKLIYGK